MRVIAGEYRSGRILSLPGLDTRPTKQSGLPSPTPDIPVAAKLEARSGATGSATAWCR